MVIFHSYVSLPEGMFGEANNGLKYFLASQLKFNCSTSGISTLLSIQVWGTHREAT